MPEAQLDARTAAALAGVVAARPKARPEDRLAQAVLELRQLAHVVRGLASELPAPLEACAGALAAEVDRLTDRVFALPEAARA